jgi:serine/threonine protein phosphatase 1
LASGPLAKNLQHAISSWHREGSWKLNRMTSLIYAIGDIHGRSDLLAKLIEFVENHSKRPGRQPRVFFLGDIVDKGPDSRGAMDIVCETLRRWPESRLLLGNHDFMFLDAMTNRRLVGGWLRNGAATTLRSYFGYDVQSLDDLIKLKSLFPEHFHVLSKACEVLIDGRYAFVHAGIDPSVPMYAQDRNILLQTRKPFLDHVGPLSHIVVHGHSPVEPPRPVITENRISLDTDAWQTGVLTTAVIDTETDRVEFFATDSDGQVTSLEPVLLDRGYGTISGFVLNSCDTRQTISADQACLV